MENLWEERAEEVAQEVCTLAGKIGARLVVVAGDVRAVQLLRQELPREVDELVREISGGRSPDGSEDAVAAATVLKELGATDVTGGRLVDVALRAAFGTGAGVRMVPATVTEGIAALLRF